MTGRIRFTLKALFRRNRFESAMSEEMRHHMSAYAADLVRAGLSQEQADRRARMEFGPIESLREDCRQSAGLRWFDELRQDLRFAARQMVRSPAFTAAAVISLALGIGANTAIFSIMDAVLLEALPIRDPQTLVFLGHRSGDDLSMSSNYPLLERYRSERSLAGATGYTWETFVLSSADGLEQVSGQFVSGNYHDVVGVPFVLGRGFATEPDRPDGRAPIAVISHSFWERKFGRSPDVIGRTLTIGSRNLIIVGVTAAGFHGLEPGARLDITLPMFVRALDHAGFLSERDGWTSLTLVGRLNPDIEEARARAAVSAIFHRFWMEPENAWARNPRMGTERFGEIAPAGRGTERLRSEYTMPLRVLVAMVGMVLLIACANVANLLLVRATVRAREVAVRLSIGAGRLRLIRQLLTESLLLAGTGGVLGLAVAVLSIDAILSAFNSGAYPIELDVTLNGRVLLFTFGVSLLTGLAFGLVPAYRATRVELAPALKDGAAALRSSWRSAPGKTLVIVQVSLCVLLLAAGGLLARSLANLRTFDAGFQREHVLLFNVDASESPFTPTTRSAYFAALEERLSGLPGVLTVAYSWRSPLDFSEETRRIRVPGFQPTGRDGVSANVVTPEYFRIFGIQLVKGRVFEPHDRLGSQKVGVISEATAAYYYASSDPIGQTFLLGAEEEPVTIIGIVQDVRQEALREAPPRMVYTSMAQPAMGLDGQPWDLNQLTVVLRTHADPRALASTVRQEARALSKDAVLSYLRTMQQQVDASLVPERLLARLSTGFGVLALLLAFVGLYGVMSYSVARRVREIGIRIAVGASHARVVRQILGETLWMSAVGIVIGLVAALVSTRVVASFLFGLSPRDPMTLIMVVVLLLVTTVIAGYRPASKASRVEPMRALRAD